MAQADAQDIFDKLEREWRLIDPDWVQPDQKPPAAVVPRRLKIARVD